MGWLEAVTFVCLIKMFHMFVSHCVCVCVCVCHLGCWRLCKANEELVDAWIRAERVDEVTILKR